MNIGIVLFDDFTDLDFFLPWDILNRVRLLRIASDWRVEILGSKESFTSASGLSVQVTKEYSFANDCDGVLFCSGPKTRELCANPDFLKNFQLDPQKQVIAAIDSGALLLGALGLLKGLHATTYPTAAKQLEAYDVTVLNQSFVADGGIATAARCLSGDRLALWIIEKLISAEAANRVFETIRPIG